MDFSIRILRQGWIDNDARHDLCSHGEIDLRIGGQQISVGVSPGESGSYGISEAALGLLRTLKFRHTSQHRVAERLIPHGCGLILMMHCDIGIDWDVRHQDGLVCIDNVVRYESNDLTEAVKFHDARIQIPWGVYAEQIVSFAAQAKALFQGIEKDTSVETIDGEFDAFWSEYDRLLEGWDATCERDLVRMGSYVEYDP